MSPDGSGFPGNGSSDITLPSCVDLRYRKQMEEMQRAFNKTIIKLQNTARIAEEQVGGASPRRAEVVCASVFPSASAMTVL